MSTMRIAVTDPNGCTVYKEVHVEDAERGASGCFESDYMDLANSPFTFESECCVETK